MKEVIFLCDKEWKIEEILEGEAKGLQKGQNLKTLISQPHKLEAAETVKQQSVLMVQLQENGEQMTGVIHRYPQYYLIFFIRIESQEDFSKFTDIYMRWMNWAEKNLDTMYRDEYFQIQQMNNQLINAQRSLMKTNKRLKEALHQVREANDIIGVLEQDELTGFFCASAFYRKCEERFAKEPECSMDMIIVDIRRFKLINEVFGRKAGDQLLKNVALFLTGLIGAEQGLFARISADTFCMLLPSKIRFYEILEKNLPRFLANYPLPIRLQARIGVYTEKDKKISAEQLCDRARLAIDLARSRGETGTAFYNQKLHDKLLHENEILDGIDGALRNHEFQAYLQPKVDMATGAVIGAEALVRWIHPQKGMIPPNEFIPLLEKEGYIYAVDRYIWEEACRILKERREQGYECVPISVNVARSDLYEPDLVSELDRILRKYEISAELLRLEIIERAYAKDSEYILQVLTQLRDRGFLIEMDDFGMGESSLSMVAGMPVDVLKLDRCFLVAGLDDRRHIEVLRFIVRLAAMLDMKIIAEGVETKEQANLLLEMGCQYAQGYYYGRPQPEDEFFTHLMKKRKDTVTGNSGEA